MCRLFAVAAVLVAIPCLGTVSGNTLLSDDALRGASANSELADMEAAARQESNIMARLQQEVEELGDDEDASRPTAPRFARAARRHHARTKPSVGEMGHHHHHPRGVAHENASEQSESFAQVRDDAPDVKEEEQNQNVVEGDEQSLVNSQEAGHEKGSTLNGQSDAPGDDLVITPGGEGDDVVDPNTPEDKKPEEKNEVDPFANEMLRKVDSDPANDLPEQVSDTAIDPRKACFGFRREVDTCATVAGDCGNFFTCMNGPGTCDGCRQCQEHVANGKTTCVDWCPKSENAPLLFKKDFCLECRSDDECGAGSYCDRGGCMPKCDSHFTCIPLGLECNKKTQRCEEVQNPGQFIEQDSNRYCYARQLDWCNSMTQAEAGGNCQGFFSCRRVGPEAKEICRKCENPKTANQRGRCQDWSAATREDKPIRTCEECTIDADCQNFDELFPGKQNICQKSSFTNNARGGCVSKCVKSSDCSPDEKCAEEGGEPSPCEVQEHKTEGEVPFCTGKNQECETAGPAECGQHSFTCLGLRGATNPICSQCGVAAGECATPDAETMKGSPCKKCTSDTECGPGSLCKNGGCETDSECDRIRPCADKKACVEGKCQKCDRAADCGPGYKCETEEEGGKICLKLDEGECKSSKDCGGFMVCNPSSRCVPCDEENPCNEGEVCVEGGCQFLELRDGDPSQNDFTTGTETLKRRYHRQDEMRIDDGEEPLQDEDHEGNQAGNDEPISVFDPNHEEEGVDKDGDEHGEEGEKEKEDSKGGSKEEEQQQQQHQQQQETEQQVQDTQKQEEEAQSEQDQHQGGEQHQGEETGGGEEQQTEKQETEDGGGDQHGGETEGRESEKDQTGESEKSESNSEPDEMGDVCDMHRDEGSMPKGIKVVQNSDGTLLVTDSTDGKIKKGDIIYKVDGKKDELMELFMANGAHKVSVRRKGEDTDASHGSLLQRHAHEERQHAKHKGKHKARGRDNDRKRGHSKGNSHDHGHGNGYDSGETIADNSPVKRDEEPAKSQVKDGDNKEEHLNKPTKNEQGNIKEDSQKGGQGDKGDQKQSSDDESQDIEGNNKENSQKGGQGDKGDQKQSSYDESQDIEGNEKQDTQKGDQKKKKKKQEDQKQSSYDEGQDLEESVHDGTKGGKTSGEGDHENSQDKHDEEERLRGGEQGDSELVMHDKEGGGRTTRQDDEDIVQDQKRKEGAISPNLEDKESEGEDPNSGEDLSLADQGDHNQPGGKTNGGEGESGDRGKAKEEDQEMEKQNEDDLVQGLESDDNTIEVEDLPIHNDEPPRNWGFEVEEKDGALVITKVEEGGLLREKCGKAAVGMQVVGIGLEDTQMQSSVDEMYQFWEEHKDSSQHIAISLKTPREDDPNNGVFLGEDGRIHDGETDGEKDAEDEEQEENNEEGGDHNNNQDEQEEEEEQHDQGGENEQQGGGDEEVAESETKRSVGQDDWISFEDEQDCVAICQGKGKICVGRAQNPETGNKEKFCAETPLARGEHCERHPDDDDAWNECAEGLHCRGPKGLCLKPFRQGPNVRCNGWAMPSWKPKPPVVEGEDGESVPEPTEVSELDREKRELECANGLFCSSREGVCKEELLPGDACIPEVSACGPGLVCMKAAPGEQDTLLLERAFQDHFYYCRPLRKVGHACNAGSEECDPAWGSCVASDSGLAVCEKNKGAGSRCTDSKECETGLFCNRMMESRGKEFVKCTEARGEGGECDDDDYCKKDPENKLACNRATKKCVKVKKENEKCESQVIPESGTLGMFKKKWHDCDRDMNLVCEEGSSGEGTTCKKGCLMRADVCNTDKECCEDLKCMGPVNGPKMCMKHLEHGQPCNPANDKSRKECGALACRGPAESDENGQQTSPMCQKPIGLGQPCGQLTMTECGMDNDGTQLLCLGPAGKQKCQIPYLKEGEDCEYKKGYKMCEVGSCHKETKKCWNECFKQAESCESNSDCCTGLKCFGPKDNKTCESAAGLSVGAHCEDSDECDRSQNKHVQCAGPLANRTCVAGKLPKDTPCLWHKIGSECTDGLSCRQVSADESDYKCKDCMNKDEKCGRAPWAPSCCGNLTCNHDKGVCVEKIEPDGQCKSHLGWTECVDNFKCKDGKCQATCAAEHQSCNKLKCCVGDCLGGENKTCLTRKLQLGEKCSPKFVGTECEEPLKCVGPKNNKTCNNALDEFMECEDKFWGSECMSPYKCYGPVNEKKCHRKLLEGDGCEKDKECGPHLKCDDVSHKCKACLNETTSCENQGLFGLSCCPGLSCLGPKGQKKCQPKGGLKEGSPCEWKLFGSECGHMLKCKDGQCTSTCIHPKNVTSGEPGHCGKGGMSCCAVEGRDIECRGAKGRQQCQDPVGEGGGCSGPKDCVEGTICDMNTNKCTSKVLPKGAPCERKEKGWTCDTNNGQQCRGPKGQRKCLDPLPEGAPCTPAKTSWFSSSSLLGDADHHVSNRHMHRYRKDDDVDDLLQSIFLQTNQSIGRGNHSFTEDEMEENAVMECEEGYVCHEKYKVCTATAVCCSCEGSKVMWSANPDCAVCKSKRLSSFKVPKGCSKPKTDDEEAGCTSKCADAFKDSLADKQKDCAKKGSISCRMPFNGCTYKGDKYDPECQSQAQVETCKKIGNDCELCAQRNCTFYQWTHSCHSSDFKPAIGYGLGVKNPELCDRAKYDDKTLSKDPKGGKSCIATLKEKGPATDPWPCVSLMLQSGISPFVNPALDDGDVPGGGGDDDGLQPFMGDTREADRDFDTSSWLEVHGRKSLQASEAEEDEDARATARERGMLSRRLASRGAAGLNGWRGLRQLSGYWKSGHRHLTARQRGRKVWLTDSAWPKRHLIGILHAAPGGGHAYLTVRHRGQTRRARVSENTIDFEDNAQPFIRTARHRARSTFVELRQQRNLATKTGRRHCQKLFGQSAESQQRCRYRRRLSSLLQTDESLGQKGIIFDSWWEKDKKVRKHNFACQILRRRGLERGEKPGDSYCSVTDYRGQAEMAKFRETEDFGDSFTKSPLKKMDGEYWAVTGDAKFVVLRLPPGKKEPPEKLLDMIKGNALFSHFQANPKSMIAKPLALMRLRMPEKLFPRDADFFIIIFKNPMAGSSAQYSIKADDTGTTKFKDLKANVKPEMFAEEQAADECEEAIARLETDGEFLDRYKGSAIFGTAALKYNLMVGPNAQLEDCTGNPYCVTFSEQTRMALAITDYWDQGKMGKVKDLALLRRGKTWTPVMEEMLTKMCGKVQNTANEAWFQEFKGERPDFSEEGENYTDYAMCIKWARGEEDGLLEHSRLACRSALHREVVHRVATNTVHAIQQVPSLLELMSGSSRTRPALAGTSGWRSVRDLTGVWRNGWVDSPRAALTQIKQRGQKVAIVSDSFSTGKAVGVLRSASRPGHVHLVLTWPHAQLGRRGRVSQGRIVFDDDGTVFTRSDVPVRALRDAAESSSMVEVDEEAEWGDPLAKWESVKMEPSLCKMFREKATKQGRRCWEKKEGKDKDLPCQVDIFGQDSFMKLRGTEAQMKKEGDLNEEMKISFGEGELKPYDWAFDKNKDREYLQTQDGKFVVFIEHGSDGQSHQESLMEMIKGKGKDKGSLIEHFQANPNSMLQRSYVMYRLRFFKGKFSELNCDHTLGLGDTGDIVTHITVLRAPTYGYIERTPPSVKFRHIYDMNVDQGGSFYKMFHDKKMGQQSLIGTKYDFEETPEKGIFITEDQCDTLNDGLDKDLKFLESWNKKSYSVVMGVVMERGDGETPAVPLCDKATVNTACFETMAKAKKAKDDDDDDSSEEDGDGDDDDDKKKKKKSKGKGKGKGKGKAKKKDDDDSESSSGAGLLQTGGRYSERSLARGQDASYDEVEAAKDDHAYTFAVVHYWEEGKWAITKGFAKLFGRSTFSKKTLDMISDICGTDKVDAVSDYDDSSDEDDDSDEDEEGGAATLGDNTMAEKKSGGGMNMLLIGGGLLLLLLLIGGAVMMMKGGEESAQQGGHGGQGGGGQGADFGIDAQNGGNVMLGAGMVGGGAAMGMAGQTMMGQEGMMTPQGGVFMLPPGYMIVDGMIVDQQGAAMDPNMFVLMMASQDPNRLPPGMVVAENQILDPQGMQADPNMMMVSMVANQDPNLLPPGISMVNGILVDAQGMPVDPNMMMAAIYAVQDPNRLPSGASLNNGLVYNAQGVPVDPNMMFMMLAEQDPNRLPQGVQVMNGGMVNAQGLPVDPTMVMMTMMVYPYQDPNAMMTQQGQDPNMMMMGTPGQDPNMMMVAGQDPNMMGAGGQGMMMAGGQDPSMMGGSPGGQGVMMVGVAGQDPNMMAAGGQDVMMAGGLGQDPNMMMMAGGGGVAGDPSMMQGGMAVGAQASMGMTAMGTSNMGVMQSNKPADTRLEAPPDQAPEEYAKPTVPEEHS